MVNVLGAKYGGIFYLKTVKESLSFNDNGVDKLISTNELIVLEAVSTTGALTFDDTFNVNKYSDRKRTLVQTTGKPMDVSYIESKAKTYLKNKHLNSSYPIGNFTYGDKFLFSKIIFY